MALSLGHTDYPPPGQSAVEHRNTAFLATPGTAASPLPGKIAKYMRKSIQHPTHKITGKAEKNSLCQQTGTVGKNCCARKVGVI